MLLFDAGARYAMAYHAIRLYIYYDAFSELLSHGVMRASARQI